LISVDAPLSFCYITPVSSNHTEEHMTNLDLTLIDAIASALRVSNLTTEDLYKMLGDLMPRPAKAELLRSLCLKIGKLHITTDTAACILTQWEPTISESSVPKIGLIKLIRANSGDRVYSDGSKGYWLGLREAKDIAEAYLDKYPNG